MKLLLFFKSLIHLFLNRFYNLRVGLVSLALAISLNFLQLLNGALELLTGLIQVTFGLISLLLQESKLSFPKSLVLIVVID